MGPGSPPPKPAWSASGKCHVGPVLTHQKSPLPAKQWLPGLIRITHPRDRLCSCCKVRGIDAKWDQEAGVFRVVDAEFLACLVQDPLYGEGVLQRHDHALSAAEAYGL